MFLYFYLLIKIIYLRTSNSFSSMFTYNLRTPKDFPIDARNIMHNIKSNNGVYNIDIATDTNDMINAILKTDWLI